MDVRHLVSVQENPKIATFGPGDTVRVSVKVVEGSRERIQNFEGVVIRRHRGGPGDESFTVRRIAAHNVGVERTFLINSPRIDKVDVLRFGRVRRARIYYLRDLRGKAARIKERARPPKVAKAAAVAQPAPVVTEEAEA